MNRERSYIENSGMPLHNAGRMRRARNDAPWLNTFDSRVAQAAEQKQPGMPVPQPGDEVPEAEGEDGARQPRTQTTGNEALAAPNLLQRAAGEGSVFENNFKMIRSVILRELRLEQGVRTLDLGCGPRTFSDLIAQEGFWIADLNRCYIEYARRACKKAILLKTAPVGFLRYKSI